MTTQDLKQLLIAEHKRDLRLTIIAYSLVLVGLLALFTVVYLYAWEGFKLFLSGFAEQLSGNGIYSYIIPFVLLSMVGYFVFNIYQLTQRMKRIDEFIEKVEANKIASSINTQTVYKIILPLIKIKLNLCPVNYALIVFDGEMKPYKLPVPIYLMPDLKTFLSGVGSQGVEGIEKAWYELYDGETAQTNENSRLKSVSEFEDYVNKELQSDIENIESQRSKGKKKFLLYLIPTIIIVGGFMVYNFGAAAGKFEMNTNTMLMIGGVLFGASYFYMIITSKKNKNPLNSTVDTSFKTKVFQKIIHFINPDFKYILHGHIGLGEFLEMGFFEDKHYDLDGNDQIIGKHSGVPFQLCDLSVSRTRNFSKENEAPDNVFYGQVFIAKFNKNFESNVFVVPKKKGTDTSSHMTSLGQKVTLEDPEFMKNFEVYSDNQVEARYILSTSMMERIKNMVAKNKGKYFISFRNNRISIANNSGKNNFEVSMFKSITKNNQTSEFYQELCSQLEMIDDLKLNINIWKS